MKARAGRIKRERGGLIKYLEQTLIMRVDFFNLQLQPKFSNLKLITSASFASSQHSKKSL
jgi:hypothetical protein